MALQIEQAAVTAQARAGLAASAAFLKRSVELTAEPERRSERALGAALAHLHAGAFDDARALLGAWGGNGCGAATGKTIGERAAEMPDG